MSGSVKASMSRGMKPGDDARQARVHTQAQIQDDHHAAGGRCQQVVDESARAVGQLLGEADTILRCGLGWSGGHDMAPTG